MAEKIFAPRGVQACVLPFGSYDILPREARRGEAFLPERMVSVIAEADAALSKEIPELTPELWRLYFETGDRQTFEDLYFIRRNMLLYLTLAEAWERKGKYLAKVREVLDAILAEPVWLIPAHLEQNSDYRASEGIPPVYRPGRPQGLDIMAGLTGGCVAVTLYYLGDTLSEGTPSYADRMRDALRERITDPFVRGGRYHWTGEDGRRVNNWCPWITANALFVAAVAEPDDEKRKLVMERSMTRLDHFVSGYPDDGGCDEGASYWGAAGAALYDALELILRMSGGAVNGFLVPIVRAIGEFMPKCHISATRFVNFADCPPRVDSCGTTLYRYGELVDSLLLRSFGSMMSAYEKGTLFFNIPYRALWMLYTQRPAPVTYQPERDSYFPALKVLVSRRGKYLLASKGGNNGESHNHNDIGNFIFCYEGEPVLIDIGAGVYSKITFSERRYELYYMQSSYHNLPDFDGVQQKAGGQYVSRDEKYNGDGGWSMELVDAYPPEAGILSYRREMRLDEEGMTLREVYTLAREETVTFHFLCAGAPEEAADGNLRLPRGRELIVPRGLTYTLDAFPVSDTRLTRNWETDTFYRLCFHATGSSGDYTFRVR